MERLSGMDAGFLYMETPTLHMHTIKAAILDTSSMPQPYTFERVREELAARLHLLPPFRRRLVRVPLDLHHPVWIEDPDFDLDRHVRRAQAPAPGDSRSFDRVISEIASTQLDRDHPLWQLTVIEGLADDHVGFVAKIHHSVADGVAASALLANVMEVAADAETPEPPRAAWRPDRVPGKVELVVGALASIWRLILGLPALLGRTFTGVRNVIRRRRQGGVSPPTPFAGPQTSFNSSLTPNRVFATTTLPLAEVKAMKAAFGATVNDVILSLVAGALRIYLGDRGEPTDRPLVAGVPVSTDDPEVARQRLGGNRVSNMFTALRIDLADPVERLAAEHDVTAAAKEMHNALGADMLVDWAEFSPPRPYAWLMQRYSGRRIADRHRPPINLVVSNVPGPREPLYIAGARMSGLFSVGPILEGIGLNITVWSYLDQLNVSLLACPERVSDPYSILDGMADELAALVKAAAAA